MSDETIYFTEDTLKKIRDHFGDDRRQCKLAYLKNQNALLRDALTRSGKPTPSSGKADTDQEKAWETAIAIVWDTYDMVVRLIAALERESDGVEDASAREVAMRKVLEKHSMHCLANAWDRAALLRELLRATRT